jgi:hypothetical protein
LRAAFAALWRFFAFATLKASFALQGFRSGSFGAG